MLLQIKPIILQSPKRQDKQCFLKDENIVIGVETSQCHVWKSVDSGSDATNSRLIRLDFKDDFVKMLKGH